FRGDAVGVAVHWKERDDGADRRGEGERSLSSDRADTEGTAACFDANAVEAWIREEQKIRRLVIEPVATECAEDDDLGRARRDRPAARRRAPPRRLSSPAKQKRRLSAAREGFHASRLPTLTLLRSGSGVCGYPHSQRPFRRALPRRIQLCASDSTPRKQTRRGPSPASGLVLDRPLGGVATPPSGPPRGSRPRRCGAKAPRAMRPPGPRRTRMRGSPSPPP